MTLHDTYCAGLEALGCERLPKRNKYTMYRYTSAKGVNRVFFVGKAGALRMSPRANAATSHPCSDALKARIVEALRYSVPIEAY